MSRNVSSSAPEICRSSLSSRISDAQTDPGRPSDPATFDGNIGIYAGIIESAMDAIISIDEQHNIVLFNQAAEKTFRCPRSQALGKPLDLFIPKRFQEAHRHHIDSFDRSNTTKRAMGRQQPLTAVRADGEEFPIEASISQAQAGGRKYFTAIIRDITERVRTLRLLTELEARYRAVFEHAGTGILTIDSQARIIDANPAIEKLLSHSNGELHQKPYGDIIHPRDLHAGEVRALLDKVESAGLLETQLQLITRHQKRVWARAIHSAVKNPLFTPLYFVVIIEDVTRKKLAARRFRRIHARHKTVIDHLTSLTEREREVMWLMVDGDPTKIIAAKLKISHKTVDVHRGRVMAKMHAESLAQLVQMVMPVRKHSNHFVSAH
jgi:PAS domain S-box-containing protein